MFIRLQFWIIIISTLAFSAEKYDLNEDILRIKRELSSVARQRAEVRKEYNQDKTEYDAYKKQLVERKAQYQADIDSISLLIKKKQAENDSLLSEIVSVKAGIQQQELLQNRFCQIVLQKSKQLLKEISNLPPLATKQIKGSLDYLISEITAQTVDNSEALHRLMQIVHDCKELSSEIDIVEGVSPVKTLPGTVYRLRIGTIFEAVVDAKGEHAFVWTKNGEWQECDSDAGSILEAVQVRGGKKVPVMVNLPFTINSMEDNDEK